MSVLVQAHRKKQTDVVLAKGQNRHEMILMLSFLRKKCDQLAKEGVKTNGVSLKM